MKNITFKSIGKKKRRVGRGDGSGRGTYSGRGMNGQSARSGGKRRPGFEGGQTPLIRKMPKLKGFKNFNRVEFQVINVSDLEKYFKEGEKVDVITLAEKNLIASKKNPVKVLGNGDLKKKLEVTVDRISTSAKEKIEASKGKATELMSAPTEKKGEKVKKGSKEEEK